METLRQAGLADIESMLPQQIPLPGKTKKGERVSVISRHLCLMGCIVGIWGVIEVKVASVKLQQQQQQQQQQQE